MIPATQTDKVTSSREENKEGCAPSEPPNHLSERLTLLVNKLQDSRYLSYLCREKDKTEELRDISEYFFGSPINVLVRIFLFMYQVGLRNQLQKMYFPRQTYLLCAAFCF